jgi:hypothetical protein
MIRRFAIALMLLTAFAPAIAGCGRKTRPARRGERAASEPAWRATPRPHGGIAAHVGDHYAELVLHPEDGDLELYTLGEDGESAKPIRASEIRLRMRVGSAEFKDLILKAPAGEPTASRFKANEPALKGATEVQIMGDVPGWGRVEFNWRKPSGSTGVEGR